MHATVAAVAAACVSFSREARATLAVMPYHSDGIILQLRSAILVDERDLMGPVPLAACSSLDDGPFCQPWITRNDGTSRRLLSPRPVSGDSWTIDVAGSTASEAPAVAAGDGEGVLNLAPEASGWLSDVARYVVDGVLSSKMQRLHTDAFDWSAETYQAFSSDVSRMLVEASAGKSTVGGRPSRQSRSRCFRIDFQRLPLLGGYLARGFSAGLPPSLAAEWEGIWEVTPALHAQGPGAGASGGRVPWASQVTLRSALGYLTFQRPVILRRLLLAVPGSPDTEEYRTWRGGPVGASWGLDSLVCGRLQRREMWCTSLAQLAATTWSLGGAGDAKGHVWTYVDVGNSFFAVDEVAFVAVPAGGLSVGLVEVAASPTYALPATGGAEPPARAGVRRTMPREQRVVLLRRHQERDAADPLSLPGHQMEPSLATISSDAATWNMNEVLQYNMRLRPVAQRGLRAAMSARNVANEDPPPMTEVLQALNMDLLRRPLGMSSKRLLEESSVLRGAVQQLQDDDVLARMKPGSLDALVQKRLREQSLDCLLTLQALWRAMIAGDPRLADQVQSIAKGRTSTPAGAPESKAAAATPGGVLAAMTKLSKRAQQMAMQMDTGAGAIAVEMVRSDATPRQSSTAKVTGGRRGRELLERLQAEFQEAAARLDEAAAGQVTDVLKRMLGRAVEQAHVEAGAEATQEDAYFLDELPEFIASVG